MRRHRRTSAELDDLVQRVGKWRKQEGGRGSRIPDELWRHAVGVARLVGVWTTAQALHFNYQALRDRMRQAAESEGADDKRAAKRKGEAAGTKRAETTMARGAEPAGVRQATATGVKRADLARARGKAGPSFIALEMGQLGSGSRTVLDLAGRHGDRMRVEVAGGVDIVGLVQTFWRGQS